MLTFLIVFVSLVFLLCVALVISCIIKKQYGEGILTAITAIVAWFLLTTLINTAVKGNQHTVVFEFPADNYQFEKIIRTTNEAKYDGNDTIFVEKQNVYYRLTGTETSISLKNSFKKTIINK